MNTLFLLMLFGVSFLLVGLMIRIAPKLGLIDIPNARSSHTHHCARGGGFVFVAIWCISASLLATPSLISAWPFILLGALLTAAVGFWDDLRGIKPSVRIIFHLLAAIVGTVPLLSMTELSMGLTSLHAGGALWLFSVLAVVWSINLFNFMDGTDGLAALEAILIFSVGGLMLSLQTVNGYGANAAVNVELSMLCGLLVASVTGFFLWNFPRAKIFMGDVGSGFLGFLIPIVAMLGEFYADLPAALWLILYGLFWSDTLITLARRMLRGEKFYEAHRSHAYQRLHHSARLSHLKVLLLSFCANTVLIVIAWIGYLHRGLLPWCLGAAFLFCCFYYLAVELIAPMSTDSRSSKRRALQET